jgi:hypothetical protein
MHSTDFLNQLRQTLNEGDCQVVILALRQDPLIWNSLKDAQFSQRVFAFAGNQVKKWNPAALTILSIFPECNTEDFNSVLARPLETDLRQKAIIQFEQSLLSGRQPNNFNEAALIAMALKERWRLRGSWQGIREELLVKAEGSPSNLFQLWSTSLACTYNLTPEQTDFLKALLPTRNSDYANDLIALCAHAILCSPASTSDQVDIFVNLLDAVQPDMQLQFLNQLYRWGRSILVNQLAQSLLKTENLVAFFKDLQDGSELNNSQSTTTTAPIDPLNQDDPLFIIEKLQQLSAFYRFSGDFNRAAQNLSLAHNANSRLEAKLLSQIASHADETQNNETSIQLWKKVVDLVPGSSIARIKLANSLVVAGQYSEAALILPDDNPIPLSIMTGIKLAQGMGDLDLAH